MSYRARTVAAIVCLAALVSACTPGRGGGTGSEGTSPLVSPNQNRILNMVMRVEPIELNDGVEDRSYVQMSLFSAGLAAWATDGSPFPVLATGLPELNTASWRVEPDGRMDTSFRLRPGLTWHDGYPLTADDFSFG